MSYQLGSKVVLSTTRLELRSLEPSDLTPECVGWQSDPEVMQYVARPSDASGRPIPPDRLLAIFARTADNRSRFFIGIFERESRRLIGHIRLACDLTHGLATPTTVIGDKSRWGRGLAVEAHVELNRFLFDDLGLNKIVIHAYASNRRMADLLTSRGYTLEGRLRQQERRGEGFEDVLVFGKLKSEWQAQLRR